MGQGKKPGIGFLIVGLGLLAFTAYLVWYGTRHGDTEPLYIVAGVFPLSLASLGWYVAKRMHVALAGALVFVLVAGIGGWGWMSWQATAERHASYHRDWEARQGMIPFCAQGMPLPDAPAYDLAAGNVTIKVIGSIYGDGLRPLQWTPWRREEYPPGWFSEGQPQLVACLTNDYRVTATKTYTGAGGHAVAMQARQHNYDVELYEARTRNLVFRTRLEGRPPGPLPDSIQLHGGESAHDQSGPRVSPNEVARALEPYVGRPVP